MSPQGVKDLLEAASKNPEVAQWLLDGYAKTAWLHAKKVFGRDFDVNQTDIDRLGDIKAVNIENFIEACHTTYLSRERK